MTSTVALPTFCSHPLGFIQSSSRSLAEWLQWRRGHPLRKCACVCIYMYIHICVCVHLHVPFPVCTCACLHMCLPLCNHGVCLCVYVPVCVCASVCVCVHGCVCVCLCINHSSVGDYEELFVFLIKGKGIKRAGLPAGPSITLGQRDFRALGSWSSGD